MRRGSRQPGWVRILDAGIQADECVDVAIAHREHHAGHAALIETHDTEALGIDERELSGACDDELEIANLRLEIRDVEPHERDVRADERRRGYDETAAGEILGRRCER